jgi:hypothetical protein
MLSNASKDSFLSDGSPSRAPVNVLTAAILVIAALLIGWSRRS